MKIEELPIRGAWKISSPVFPDDRGLFTEWFKSSEIERLIGFKMTPVQANMSCSHAGVVRGIHYSLVPGGQHKLVSVFRGRITDVIVDIRPHSDTFGKYCTVEMSAADGQAVLISGDLGHAFQAHENDTVVAYLVSAEFSPEKEHGISPECPQLNIEWSKESSIVLSDKDRNAPTLHQQLASGLLPPDPLMR